MDFGPSDISLELLYLYLYAMGREDISSATPAELSPWQTEPGWHGLSDSVLGYAGWNGMGGEAANEVNTKVKVFAIPTCASFAWFEMYQDDTNWWYSFHHSTQELSVFTVFHDFISFHKNNDSYFISLHFTVTVNQFLNDEM